MRSYNLSKGDLPQPYQIEPINMSDQPDRELKERLLQLLYEHTLSELGDRRALNLAHRNAPAYTDFLSYAERPQAFTAWNGLGRHTLRRLNEALTTFGSLYAQVGKSDGFKVRRWLVGFDYPFLDDFDASFVASYLMHEGTYPVFFIAERYFATTTNRNALVFGHIQGIAQQRATIAEMTRTMGLTEERVRQLGVRFVPDNHETSRVWDRERWMELPFMSGDIFTAQTMQWEELQRKQHLHINLHCALQLINIVRPINTVSLVDGRYGLARLSAGRVDDQIAICFAYTDRFAAYAFAAALADIYHLSHLQRIEDYRMDFNALFEKHIVAAKAKGTDISTPEWRQEAAALLRSQIEAVGYVHLEGDEIVCEVNRMNYFKEIYDILKERGEAMTVDDIYNTFKAKFPDDHHTDSGFIRSYMLQDKRFQAVGRTSTYQLVEWGRFAGSMVDMAVMILQQEDEPLSTDELCRRVVEMRPTTNEKSVTSTIYYAVNNGTLLYYYPDLVGLPDRQYADSFWLSPRTLQGTINSLHRFVAERKHFPYHNGDGIERSLHNALRKYTVGSTSTEQEKKQFAKGIANINESRFPRTPRDQKFGQRCRAVTAFFRKYGHVPTTAEDPVLGKFYAQTIDAGTPAEPYRRREYERMYRVVNNIEQPAGTDNE